MTDLPSLWALCEIGEVLAPVEMTGKNEPDRKIWYIDISSIDNRSNRITEPKRLQFSEAPSRARQKIISGDVLFSTVRPYLRKIAAVDPEFDGEIASTGFAVLRGFDGIEPKYLYYKSVSSDFVSALTGEQYGVSYPAVKEEQVKAQSLELPPTKEQRRIVEKIEALFEEIDAGVESLRTARVKLGLYRQSLLKSAFEGRLTADWRTRNADKLEPPETLLARIQSERDTRYKAALDAWQTALTNWRANGEQGKKPAKPKRPNDLTAAAHDRLAIPSNWITAALGGVAFEAVLGKMLDRQKNQGEPRPYLGNINLRWGAFDVDAEKTMRIEDREVPRYGIRREDLVICEGGEPGRCAVWQGADDSVFIQKALHRVRFTQSYSSWFTYYFLKFATLSGLLDKHYTGSTIKHLTGKALDEVLLPICSPAEQTEIVRILDEKLSAADAMEAEIDAALTRAEALRQSILKKAFSGKLVPQDPNDEPASTLLARIQTARAAAPKAKRTRKAPA